MTKNTKKEIEVKRPLVRYHGGKFMLSEWIISHFPAHKCYVEGFGGGGSVLLKKNRSPFEVYNDLDGEMVNLFRCVRDNGQQLKELVYLTPFSREEWELCSLQVEGLSDLELARRTIFRSFSAFGSAAIANSKSTGFRSGGIKSGTALAISWANYPEHLQRIIDRLRGVVIECEDAIKICSKNDSVHTLHYLDPPYVFSTRGLQGNRKCYRFEMTDDQHVELLKKVQQLKGFVIISGYENEIYTDLLKDFNIIQKKVLADNRTERTECLYLSPNVPLNKTLFD